MSGKWKRKALLTAGIIILVLGLLIQGTARKNGKEKSTGGRIMEGLAEAAMERALADSCLLPFFLEQGQGTLEDDSPAGKAVEEMFPLYTYTFHEVQEGEDEDQKNIDEENLDYGEGALHIDSDLIARMQQENDGYQENMDQAEISEENDQENTDKEEDADTGSQGESQQDDGMDGEKAFEPAAFPAYSYDWSEKWDYEKLVSNFYAIDGTTGLDSSYVGLDQLLYQDMSITRSPEGPDILIYHTHSLEDFADSVPGDPSTTIVGAGERLTEILQDTYGFSVMHDIGGYDVEARDEAYNKSLPAIEQILAENPTIQVVIDLHRDEMKEGKKLVMELDGRPTARYPFKRRLS